MSDSCGQVNAAMLATTRLGNMTNAAQMSKGGRNVMMPSSQQVQQVGGGGGLNADFAAMNINNAQNAALQSPNLMTNISQNWGDAGGNAGVGGITTMPTTIVPKPITHTPGFVQPQHQQPSSQHYQQAMRQQSMMFQHQQQQQQQQHMMMALQHQQQQSMMQQQQQQQQLQSLFMQQQQLQQMQQLQQNVQNQQPVVVQNATVSTTNDQAPMNIIDNSLTIPTTTESQSLFDTLRNQQREADDLKLKQLDDMSLNDASLEEPVINGDISQYLEDNFQHMYHAGGNSHANLHEQQHNDMSSSHIFEQMLNSDNEKWKNSKFVQFINKYERGEIDFTDDDVIHREFEDINDQDDPSTMNEALWNGLLEDAQMDEAYEGDKDWHQDWIENWKNNIELPSGYEELEAKIHDNIRKFTDATNADPQEVNNTYERGVALFDRGEIYQAIDIFNHVTINDPTHSNAWMYLGKSYAQLDQDPIAIQCLEKCLSLDAYNLTALLALGVSLSNSHNRHTAVSHLVTWMTNHPEFSVVDTTKVENIITQIENEGPLQNLTDLLTDATIDMFNEAVKTNPNEVDVYTVLGLLHLIQQNYDQSIASFTTALQHQPDNPELWNRLGAVIANSGRHIDAPNFYKQALHLRPHYVRAKVNCAQAYLNTRQYHRAYPIFLDVILNSPDATSTTTPNAHLWPMLRQCFDFTGYPGLSDAVMMRDITVLKQAMEEHGMNNDGTVREGFQQPIGADLD